MNKKGATLIIYKFTFLEEGGMFDGGGEEEVLVKSRICPIDRGRGRFWRLAAYAAAGVGAELVVIVAVVLLVERGVFFFCSFSRRWVLIAATMAGSRDDGTFVVSTEAGAGGVGGVGGGLASGMEESVAAVGLAGMTDELEDVAEDAKEDTEDRLSSRRDVRMSEIGTRSTVVGRNPPPRDDIPFIKGAVLDGTLLNCFITGTEEDDSPPDCSNDSLIESVLLVSPPESSGSEWRCLYDGDLTTGEMSAKADVDRDAVLSSVFPATEAPGDRPLLTSHVRPLISLSRFAASRSSAAIRFSSAFFSVTWFCVTLSKYAASSSSW